MKELELEATKRELLGKKVKSLRRQGIVPAHVYGNSVDSLALQIEAKALQKVLSLAGETGVIHLKVAGAKQPRMVLMRQVQRDPVSGEWLHVDFYQVKMTEKIKAEVPLVFTGEPPAVKSKGAIPLHSLNTLHVEALPGNLPRSIEVDLSRLEEVDQAIFAKDISLPENVTLVTDPEQMVVKVAGARREEEVEVKPAAAAAEVRPEAEAEAGAEAPAAGGAKPAK